MDNSTSSNPEEIVKHAINFAKGVQEMTFRYSFAEEKCQVLKSNFENIYNFTMRTTGTAA
jgi:hypothetical protein